jgi:hypothetical protein
LIKTKDGRVIDIIDQTPFSSKQITYDAVAADLDYNGYSDLVVARSDGVTLYKNKGKGRFETMKLSGPVGNGALKLSIVDYNKDGHADVYISSAKGKSKLLEGLGGGIMFEDVTALVGNGVHNGQLEQLDNVEGHFDFRDVNNDRIPDLVSEDKNTIFQGTRGSSGAKFTSGFQFLKRVGGFFQNANLNDVVKMGKNSFDWINIHQAETKGASNFVGVRLPDRIPFFNSTVHLVTVNDLTGKTHNQNKQVKGGEDIIRFDIGKDTRVLHLSVRTIYDNVYEHPYPKINVISSFRDAKW